MSPCSNLPAGYEKGGGSGRAARADGEDQSAGSWGRGRLWNAAGHFALWQSAKFLHMHMPSPPTTPRPLPHTPHPGFRVCVNKKENLSLPNNHLTTAWARKSHTPRDGLTAGIADWGFVHRMRLHAKRVHKTNRTYTFSLSHMHAHTNMLIYSRKGKWCVMQCICSCWVSNNPKWHREYVFILLVCTNPEGCRKVRWAGKTFKPRQKMNTT